MKHEVEEDSRTATVGRKRQREPDGNQDLPAATPDKKPKLDDTDAPPSREGSDRVDSWLPKPVEPPSHTDDGFPHMSAEAQEAVVKASELSSAQESADAAMSAANAQPDVPLPKAEGEDDAAIPDDMDQPISTGGGRSDDQSDDSGSENEIDEESGELADDPGEKDGGVERGQSPGQLPASAATGAPMQITKEQSGMVQQFEEKRARSILRRKLNGIWSKGSGVQKAAGFGVVLQTDIPQGIAPRTGQPSNAISKAAIHSVLLMFLGSTTPNGLVGIYMEDADEQSSVFNVLLVYRKQEQVHDLEEQVALKPLSFKLKKGMGQKQKMVDLRFSVLEGNEIKQLEFKSTKNTKQRSPSVLQLGKGLSQYVRRLLQSGRLSADDYAGFNTAAGSAAVKRALQVDIGAGIAQGDKTKAAAKDQASSSAPTSESQPAQSMSKSGATTSSEASSSMATPTDEAQRAQSSFDTDNAMDVASGEEGEIVANTSKPQFDAIITSDATTGPRTRISQLSEEERMLQTRYFGATNEDDGVHCLTCGKAGHMAESCPSTTCQHCLAVKHHFSNACPRMSKCIKCRERGHKREFCPSKLARSAADGFFCDACKQKGHVEEECSLLWRTFIADEVVELKKVERLTVSCYECGSHRHWGDDCPMRPRRGRGVGVDTFSAKEANKYLTDPEAADKELKKNGFGGGMSIKGRAHNADFIGFESEDDGGDIDNFYRNRRQNNAPTRGNIRIGGRFSQKNGSKDNNNNNNNNNNNGNGRQRYETRSAGGQRSRSPPQMYKDDYRQRDDSQFTAINKRWQPPLPNEPPPPLPAAPVQRGGGFGGGRGGRGRGRGGKAQAQAPRAQGPVGPPRKPRSRKNKKQ